MRVTSTVIFTFTMSGLAALVACYYYGLRNRRHYTALTEVGLAVRSILARVAAFAALTSPFTSTPVACGDDGKA